MTARTKAALLLAMTASIAVPLAALGGDGARGAAASRATASAEAFKRDGSAGQSGYVKVDDHGRRAGKGTAVRASVAGGKGSAAANASVGAVNLFSGLVTASSVSATATATGAGTTVGGNVTGLAIQGEPLGSLSSPAKYELAGYGTLAVLASDGTGITGLHATLTKQYKGHPAGSTMSVAFARAGASDGTVAAPPRAKPPAPERPARERRQRRARVHAPAAASGGASRRDEGPPSDQRAKRRKAPDLTALPTDSGYVFPVYGGEYSFGDDYGAPRQHTGSHEGNDIYAPTGTPVRAVADGVLYRVGTRQVPGNRMWLKTASEDTFFFAHLAAFAHDARNGARVRAGDVIGFVGSTGDAERTPPHLHFEIHPQDGEALNPYPFLRAWEARRDVPHAAWLARYGNDPGSRPGALVVLRDFLERH